MGNVMKSLENRNLDSKREMDILAALVEMKSMKDIGDNFHKDGNDETIKDLGCRSKVIVWTIVVRLYQYGLMALLLNFEDYGRMIAIIKGHRKPLWLTQEMFKAN